MEQLFYNTFYISFNELYEFAGPKDGRYHFHHKATDTFYAYCHAACWTVLNDVEAHWVKMSRAQNDYMQKYL